MLFAAGAMSPIAPYAHEYRSFEEQKRRTLSGPPETVKKVVIPISSAHYSAPRAGFAGCALYAPAGAVA